MELPDLKKLDKLIALCRKRGVVECEVQGFKFKLQEDFTPRTPKAREEENLEVQPFPEEPTALPGDLTDEQLLFYSTNDAGAQIAPEEEK